MGRYVEFGANDVFEGEVFLNKGVVVPSDHVKATPWWFSKTTISNPQAIGHILTTPPGGVEKVWYCQNPWASRNTVDVSCFHPITQKELIVPTIDRSVLDMVDSMAIIKAQANLRKAMSNLPMIFAERKAAAKSIKKYSRAILNNVITLQRKDVKEWIAAVQKYKTNQAKLKRIARDIANNHLEFVFGIMPLLDDIHGLCEFLTETKIDIRTGRGRHTWYRDIDQKQKLPPRGADAGTFSLQKKTRHRYSVRTGLRYTIDSTLVNDMSKLGFNPIYAWYDLTPLSFVTGWFSNLNYWLQSMDPIPGLSYDTGFSTKRTEVTVDRTISNGSATFSGYTAVGIGSSVAKGQGIYQTRVVHDKPPSLQGLRFVDNTSIFALLASVSLSVQRGVKDADKVIALKPFRYRGPRPRNLPPIKWKKP